MKFGKRVLNFGTLTAKRYLLFERTIVIKGLLYLDSYRRDYLIQLFLCRFQFKQHG